jgi:nucleotide-binding universal stress UspA family protein
MQYASDTELLERGLVVGSSPEFGGIKTILFHVTPDDFVMDRLQVTLALARACSAHVQCLHVTPMEAYTIVDVFGGTFVNHEIVSVLEKEAAKLRDRIESKLATEDVNWDYVAVTGETASALAQRGALADLIVTGRESRERDFAGAAIALFGDLLAKSRTPLLVLGGGEEQLDPFGTAVVAWNGSYEAANAVRGSLPLLRMAADVRVVYFAEEQARLFPSTSVLEYLSRHGVEAELHIGPAQPAAIDIGIIEYALQERASYVVIGGYSHSRAGEFLFGGVTRSLLKSCPVPLVVAH